MQLLIDPAKTLNIAKILKNVASRPLRKLRT